MIIRPTSLVGICSHRIMMSQCNNDVTSQQWVSLCFHNIVLFSLKTRLCVSKTMPERLLLVNDLDLRNLHNVGLG